MDFGFDGQQTYIRGGGFLVFGPSDLNQTYTQTGIDYFAGTVHGNWVTFNPYWMYNSNTNPGALQSGVGEWFPDSDLLTAIGWAKAAGLKIMLKPMIDPRNSDATGTWRALLDPGTSGIAAFMASYISFISGYAQIAADNDIDLFCIGCELSTLITGPGISGNSYTTYWTDPGGVIPTVRAIYSGPLTYAGYPTDPAAIWSAVDYLGWDFYPSLINTTVNAYLSTSLSSGSNITALPVDPLSAAMGPGTVTLDHDPNVQSFSTPGAAAGATSIPVASATVAANFPSGTWAAGPSMLTSSTNLTLLEAGLTTITPQSGASSYVSQLAAFSAANGDKKIILTEAGFQNRVGSASGSSSSSTPAPAEQAAAVQALVTVLEQGDYSWYEGLFFWGWFCHYDQTNGNTGYNQYGNLAADRLAALWSAGIPLVDGSGKYLTNHSGTSLTSPA